MSTLTIEVGTETALFQMRQGETTEQYKIPTGESFTIADLNRQLAELESDYGLANYRLALAFPGMVRDNQLISCRALPALVGLNPEKLSSRGELVAISNDIHAGLHAIASVKHQCELLVMCGTGIGMSLALNGRVFSGANGLAGELGACRVMTESGEFSLEQLASGESVRRRRLRNPVELYRAGAYLGMGIAWAVNLLNPQKLWLAGNMLANADYYKGCVSGVKDLAVPATVSQCQISRVDDMETLVCRGLQVMLMQQA
ncbi:ROK family protein [Shewanella algae]|uniref:ROK family protein n=1 Tax=Shewanella algae TaxID=38313 RepID=UPI00118377DB|nr:ROK family protein [Shewanella algae]MBO2661468.1 ROK family protein [Shewanella algae]MCL1054449.1 ROK family protein [Shewanella algae]TVO90173.1 hypothetical protein AYI80_10060 [Shewanella algae]TXS85867.1 hypothetical protein AYI81_13220 [Shewanella algae]